MAQTRIIADTSKLEALVSQLGGDFVARVGILGSDAGKQHPDSDITNSELGVIQEFGSVSRNIPARSFLRMPIETRQETIINAMGKSAAKRRLDNGDIRGVYEILGLAGEAVVKGAFQTGGFGQWEANAPATIAAKGSSAPLIDQGELRRAVTSDVVRKGEI